MNSFGHWAPRVPCETCGSKFHTQSQADQHMKAKGHYKNYCSSCDRHFVNENNLRMHMNSKIHRGTRISCPFCKKDYTSATGLAHHLETGSCPNAPNVNRQTIHRVIRERDVDGVVTNNLIEWYEEDSSEYSATDRAFNGYCWECYICHKGFNSKRGLDQHLNSPVHKQKLYHCPNRKSECGKEFVSLAALFNHLESETCAFMRFEKVQQQVGHVLQGRNRLTFQ